jgi:hypothetical protein
MMRHTRSKHENMPKVMAILAANPKARIPELARLYGIPDATIRGVWRNEQVRLREANELASLIERVDKSPSPNILKAESATTCLDAAPKQGGFFSDRPQGKRILVIGDQQRKPDLDLGPCRRIGRYAADKKPDIIVNIGDFADMPSLSFHDVPGSMGYEGQRYKNDLLAVHQGMKAMMEPIQEEMRCTGWKPRLVLTLGNHEDRIDRTIKAIPKLDGVMGLPDLEYARWGWEVIPFLKPVIIEGVAFSHYFCSGQMGRPVSSARAMLTKMHMSCVAGHQQGRDMAMGKRADGKSMTAIICGSSYEHDENYLNYQTNDHWRGIYVLNDVVDGSFEENAVSMAYLRRKYGN